MVQHADVDEVESAPEFQGQCQVIARGGSAAGWMVVGEQHRGGVLTERSFDDFARWHCGSGQGAAEQFLEGEQAVAVVEPSRGEDFMLVSGELEAKPVGGDGEAAKQRPGASGAGFQCSDGTLYQSVAAACPSAWFRNCRSCG
ncbi:MAG: hypothetical protein BGP24_12455 [Lysobacterales bacterium 69-70]|nr:MAG: hypothetical protein ABS97_22215 [Xanthomonadaceae bacterium SCN 69-320]ODV20826.1 MAG: hypothetical protein ABT27_06475 [Xanthomonadaceae bacterium SCN 69-25]OJY98598.1 MAG: hypothetical protein BGP24_12455 [Xanthomonadales bacterium 69-70]